jgi:hypothetical protein
MFYICTVKFDGITKVKNFVFFFLEPWLIAAAASLNAAANRQPASVDV